DCARARRGKPRRPGHRLDHRPGGHACRSDRPGTRRGGGAARRARGGAGRGRRGAAGARTRRAAAARGERGGRPALGLRAVERVLPGARAAVPDPLPGRRAAADLPALPAGGAGAARPGGGAGPARRPGLGAGRRVAVRDRLAAARRLRRLHLAQLPAAGHRRGLRAGAVRPGADRDLADGRAGAAGDLPALHRLRLRRRPDPQRLADRPPRLRLPAADLPVRDGHRGPLRGPAGRRGHLHHPVHDLRRGPGVLRRRPVLPRHQLRGLPPVAIRARPDGDPRRLPAGHRVRVRNGHRGQPRQRRLAHPEAGRLPAGVRRWRAGRRRHRGDPVPAHAGGGGVHHRRAAAGLLPDGPGLRAHPDAAVLPGHLPGGRVRRPTVRRPRGAAPASELLAAARPVRLPLQLVVRHRRAPGAGPVGLQGGRLRHRPGLPALVPGPQPPDDPAPGLRGAGQGRRRGAPGRRDDGRGGADRGGADADRARPGPVLDHRGPGRAGVQQCHRPADGDLRAGRRRGARARPGRAGDSVLHHRRGDHRPGADLPGRGHPRGLHVHLLLRGALRGQPADGAGRRGRSRHHRRERLQDDDHDVQVHAAGLPRAAGLRAHHERPGSGGPGRRGHRPVRDGGVRTRCRLAGRRHGQVAHRPGAAPRARARRHRRRPAPLPGDDDRADRPGRAGPRRAGAPAQPASALRRNALATAGRRRGRIRHAAPQRSEPHHPVRPLPGDHPM
ncbi:MAG: TRAP-type uncharacterized transport system, fused permease component, partial [uncultured Blastococcus sp.]